MTKRGIAILGGIVTLGLAVMSGWGWWFALPAVAASKPMDPGTRAAEVAKYFEKVLPQLHLSHQPLDIGIATNALALYLTMLDFDRTFFLASDIDEFQKEGALQVERLHKGDVSLAFRVFERFKERARNRVEYADTLIGKGFDCTTQESYAWKRKDLAWPENEAEWNELWRKKVKSEFVARLVAKELADSEKTNGTAKAESEGEIKDKPEGATNSTTMGRASDGDALLSPDAFIRKRYKQFLMALEDSDAELVLQRYFTAFAQAYDPHSEYMTPSSSEDFEIGMKLSLGGIGALLQSEDGAAKIEKIIPGGPAARDGRLKPGDKIIAVTQEAGEAVDILHWPLYKAVGVIRGKKGSKVTLTVIPASDTSGARTTKITLVRDEVKLEDQAAKGDVVLVSRGNGLTNHLGIIHLPAFYADMKNRVNGSAEYKSSTRDIARIIVDMKEKHAEGIILDLRDNGGGSLAEAVEMTGLFFPSGPVVQVRESRGVQVLQDPDPDVLYRGPLVVLVNRRSASASEILAAALQDYGRAVIVGDSKTHGKGTVQSWQPLDERNPALGSIKVTTHSFYRVAGGSTQMKGVIPDIRIPSVLDVLEVGEEYLPHAMPWTVISMARYNPVADLSPQLPILKHNSEERRAKDPRFVSQNEVIERVKKQQALSWISLNLKERVELAREEKNLDKAQDEAMGDSDTDGGGAMGKNPEKDLVLRETENILTDLIRVWRGKEPNNENSVLENAWSGK
ncbi:MAG: carboxy terminal-processing peptidase [bacterium]